MVIAQAVPLHSWERQGRGGGSFSGSEKQVGRAGTKRPWPRLGKDARDPRHPGLDGWGDSPRSGSAAGSMLFQFPRPLAGDYISREPQRPLVPEWGAWLQGRYLRAAEFPRRTALAEQGSMATPRELGYRVRRVGVISPAWLHPQVSCRRHAGAGSH